MPIDATILTPMIDPFKNMAQECTDKGMSGPHYDEMMTALHRMEALGQEHSDFMAFSTQMTTEGLQLSFSNAYGRLLSEEASQTAHEASSADPDKQDRALLAQNITALRNAVNEIKKGKEQANAEAAKHTDDPSLVLNEIDVLFKADQLIAPIEELITYGESGINFPTFLRVQIERGMDKAMDGSGVVKEGLQYSLDAEKATATSPFLIRIREEELQAFEAVAARSSFGIPDSFHLQLATDRVSRKYEKEQAHWSQLTQWWSGLFDTIDTWVLAQTKYAPGIQPWSMAGSPAAIQEAIRFSKHTIPPDLRVRFHQYEQRFLTSFSDVMNEATFQWAVDYDHFAYSETYTRFILSDVLPALLAGVLLSDEQVETANGYYADRKMGNPDVYKVFERQKVFIDSYFGEGHLSAKIGGSTSFDKGNSAPWNKFNS